MSATYWYQPGAAHLVLGSRGGVLTPDGELALQLWPLIRRGAPLAALLDEVLAAGLAHLPDLLLFELDSAAIRVLVRGKSGVSVRSADGRTERVDGQAMQTWNERVFEHPVEVSAGEEAERGLPLVSGVVLVSGFSWRPPATDDNAHDDAHHDTHDDAHDDAHDDDQLDNARPRPSSAPMIEPATVAETSLRTATQASALPDTRIEPVDDSFGHLFESTVMRSVEDAAVRVADDDPAVLPPGDPTTLGAELPHPSAIRPGDHDGSTILAGQLAAVLASAGDPAIRPTEPDPTDSMLLTLLLSTGQIIGLDRSVVIGRRPQVDRVSGAQIPHLVTVASPQQDISRSHVAVRPSGTGCLAVDLGSTNGSVIRRAAGGTVSLRDGATLDLQPGDLIDLGDGVTAMLRAPA